MGIQQRKNLIEVAHPVLSIVKQCELLDLSRSTYYYVPCPESAENLKLMRVLDELYLDDPSKGARLLHQDLLEKGFIVNIKKLLNII